MGAGDWRLAQSSTAAGSITSSASPCTMSQGQAGEATPSIATRVIPGATATSLSGAACAAARTATAPPKENPASHSEAPGQRSRP